jgi:hypothetical protein
VVVLAALGVVGWQKHWPPSVFGTAQAPPLAWTAEQAPLPSDAAAGSGQNAALDGVACPDAGSCVAVGSYAGKSGGSTVPEGLVETFSQGTWVPTAVAGLTGSHDGLAGLIGVDCAAQGSCVAVGDLTTGSQEIASPVGEILSGST